MRFVLLTLCLWLGLTSAHASTPSNDEIDALIQASGMQAQLRQIPDALRAAGQQQGGLGAGIVKPLVSALRTVFDPKEMQQIMRTEMIKQMDVATLVDAMKWFNSEDAKAILAAEQRMMEPAVMKRISDAMNTQTVESLTDERKLLLQNIDKATGATDAALDLMMNMQAAFLTAFSHLLMPEQANEFSATLESFAGTRSQYQRLVQEQLLLQQAVLLEPVNDTSLQHLQIFAQSDSGQKTLKALNVALNNTIRTVAKRIPEAMTQEEQARQPFKPEPAPTPAPPQP